MVNAGGGTRTALAVIPGMSGTAEAVLANIQNAGNYGSLYTPNPQGQQPPTGGEPSGLEAQGSGNVGGRNGPPMEARSGVTPGDGTSTSCMTSQELSANNGTEPPPPENQIGKPSEGACTSYSYAPCPGQAAGCAPGGGGIASTSASYGEMTETLTDTLTADLFAY